MELIILRSVPRRNTTGAENQNKGAEPEGQTGNPRLMSMEEVRRRWQAKRNARSGTFCDSPQPA